MGVSRSAAPQATGEVPPAMEDRSDVARPSVAQRIGLGKYSAAYLWLLFIVLFGILEPDTFLTGTTFKLVFSEGVVTAILALAFLVPLTANTYDLTIGANLALSLVLSNYIGLHSGIPPLIGAVLSVLACMLTGFVSGWVVVKLRVNSFIATLGMSQALTALVLLISANRQLTGAFPQSWLNAGQNNIAGIPIVVLYLLVIAIAVWYVLEHTTTGRYLFATGGNLEASRLAGVKTDKMIWGSLIASGGIAGIAGVVFSMRTGIFSSDIGPGYLFPAIAAVFLGASQFSQRPNVWGTIIAYFALAFGIKGLQLVSGTNSYWVQPLFEGTALVVAVALAARPAVGAVKAKRKKSASPAPAKS